MPISGTLDAFSIPEIFQIIESGNKTGILSFKFSLNNLKSTSKGTFEIWFKKGSFIAIANSLEYQFLIDRIIENGWMNAREMIKIQRSYSTNQALGTYLQEQNLLNETQIDLLFKTQIDRTIELFNMDRGWFTFKDIDINNTTSYQEISFPWKEMTGREKKATQLSLEAMRNFSNWSRFMNEIPLPTCGLQRIALISAGRTRGKNLVTELGLAGSNPSLEDLASKLDFALGENGTRLCKVDKIEEDGDSIKVYTHETVCSAGEEMGSTRKCTYSMGAVCGAIETIQGKRYRPKHTESVLRGGSHDVFEMSLIG